MGGRLLKNAFSNATGYVIQVLVAFWLTPFVIHGVGQAAYGVWVVVVSLTGYLGLLDLGVRSTLPKYVAQYAAQHDDVGLNRFVNTVLAVSLVMGAVALTLTVIAAVAVPRLVVVDAAYSGALPGLTLLTGASLAAAFPFAVFQGVLVGYQRFGEVNAIGLAGLLLRSALIVLALRHGYGVVALGVITVGTNVATSIVFTIRALAVAPMLRLRLFAFDRAEFGRIATFSMSSFTINVSDRMIYYSASMIIGVFVSTSAVTIFAIGESLAAYMRQGVLSLVTVLTPAASRLQAGQEIERLREMAVQSTKWILTLILPVGIGSVLLGPAFIRLWMGEGYEQSATVLAILMTAQTLALSQYGPELMLYGLSRHRSLARLMLAVAISALTLAASLARPFGVVGVAVGLAVPLCLGQTLGVPLILRRAMGLRIGRYVRFAILPPALAAIGFAVALTALVSLWPPVTWGGLIAVVAGAGTVYAPAILFLACSRDERMRLWRIGAAAVPNRRTA